MAIKTDAMIAHNGADGYTLHIDYDPETDAYQIKIVFNDGTVKESDDYAGDGALAIKLLKGTLTGNFVSDVSELGEYALAGQPIASAYIPECTRIRNYAFLACNMLQSVNAPKAEIVNVAFERCKTLAIVIFPKAVSLIGTFRLCSSLAYVYIGPDCTSIQADTFYGVNNVTIDCGFSNTSPAAANAPWGATNATINYDVPAPNPPALSSLRLSPDPGLIQSIDLEPLEEIQPVEPDLVVVKKTTKRRAK